MALTLNNISTITGSKLEALQKGFALRLGLDVSDYATVTKQQIEGEVLKFIKSVARVGEETEQREALSLNITDLDA